ncbi:MAG: hypothetical protein B1H40_01230 [Candidatus Latescibacteria bacterium 4484_181]|nr:MAG: hypothetical protein B1H40_01230 [Candidatus Latescibacteria bacterium 4484_181]RKY69155.1 MAG: hypothetical protein DRQ02_01950 [Candidatus Latescibacterota bacterium]RKY73405.1 MAG: hypothetical protein DRQ24_02390 [Candidatus Latescibacterota bacterium]
MKNRREISSQKELRIDGQSYLIQTFCPYRDRQEGMYQKTFLNAKFGKKPQRSQRGNYLFMKMPPILCQIAFFAVILNRLLLLEPQDVISKLKELNPDLSDTGADCVGKWGRCHYRGLASDIYFRGRTLQSPTPSASGHLLQSVFRVEWSSFSVKLPFFSRIWARDRKIFREFFRIWIEKYFRNNE